MKTLFLIPMAPMLLILGACARPSERSPENPVGSYSEVSSKEPEIVKAAEFAAAQLSHGKLHTLDKIDGAERQIVAGTNYRLTLQLRSGARWEVVVYCDLGGNFALTSSRRL